MSRVSCRSIRVATALGLILAALATSAQAEVIQRGAVTVYKADPASQASLSAIDFVNARPFPLPEAPESASVAAQQDLMNILTNQRQSSAPIASGHSLGRVGNGETNPVTLRAPAVEPQTTDGEEFESQQFGTGEHPFSTARADLDKPTNTRYPYRASGKLFFQPDPFSNAVCSASLIKRGLVVTAAHCVVEFGTSQFYSSFIFVPGYRNGVAPFGSWLASAVHVTTGYATGAPGQCAAIAPGVICKDDVALIELVPQGDPTTGFPGTNTGWYSFAFGNSGFTDTDRTHITQTGYPVAWDSGERMLRNDSEGYRSTTLHNNTIIGSLMTGGSSGGPWLNNFGYRPTDTGPFSYGTFSNPNTVVGVASWGYTSGSPKEQGASPFLSTNIKLLVNNACGVPVTDPRCL